MRRIALTVGAVLMLCSAGGSVTADETAFGGGIVRVATCYNVGSRFDGNGSTKTCSYSCPGGGDRTRKVAAYAACPSSVESGGGYSPYGGSSGGYSGEAPVLRRNPSQYGSYGSEGAILGGQQRRTGACTLSGEQSTASGKTCTYACLDGGQKRKQVGQYGYCPFSA